MIESNVVGSDHMLSVLMCGSSHIGVWVCVFFESPPGLACGCVWVMAGETSWTADWLIQTSS